MKVTNSLIYEHVHIWFSFYIFKCRLFRSMYELGLLNLFKPSAVICPFVVVQCHIIYNYQLWSKLELIIWFLVFTDYSAVIARGLELAMVPNDIQLLLHWHITQYS